MEGRRTWYSHKAGPERSKISNTSLPNDLKNVKVKIFAGMNFPHVGLVHGYLLQRISNL